MPNWCDNSMRISNQDKTKIDALEAVLQSDDKEIFKHLRPNPNADWQYDWSVENWGTKWDAAHGYINLESSKEHELGLDTAWSPPIPFYKKLEEMGFSVSAEYKEDGLEFIGEYADGVDECYEYDFSNEDWRDELPEHIVEQLEYDYENWKEWQEQEEQEVE